MLWYNQGLGSQAKGNDMTTQQCNLIVEGLSLTVALPVLIGADIVGWMFGVVTALIFLHTPFNTG